MKVPDFFIVGAAKCGTTAMADYLGQHPEIFMPVNKDSNPLGSDLVSRRNVSHPPDKFRVSLEEFLSWYQAAPDGKRRFGDASVLYMVSRRAAAEVQALSPHAQIIVMLRNPADMLYSLHGHMFNDLNEDIGDFEAALDAEPDRRAGRRIPATCWAPFLLHYSEMVRYAEQLERYFELFGREKVHAVIYDDLRDNTPLEYRKILQFLGINPDFQPDFRVLNAAKNLRSRALMQFIVTPPWPIRPVAESLSRVVWLRNVVYGSLLRFNYVEKRPEPMKASVRRRLNEQFRPEVERLSELLGRDLTHWTRESKPTAQAVGC